MHFETCFFCQSQESKTAVQQRYRHRLFLVINQRQLRHHRCTASAREGRGERRAGHRGCRMQSIDGRFRYAERIAQSCTRATLSNPQQVHRAIQNYPGAVAGNSV